MSELDRVLDALVKSKEELIKKEASEEERNERKYILDHMKYLHQK